MVQSVVFTAVETPLVCAVCVYGCSLCMGGCEKEKSGWVCLSPMSRCCPSWYFFHVSCWCILNFEEEAIQPKLFGLSYSLSDLDIAIWQVEKVGFFDCQNLHPAGMIFKTDKLTNIWLIQPAFKFGMDMDAFNKWFEHQLFDVSVRLRQ